MGGEVRNRSWKVLKKGGILVALNRPAAFGRGRQGSRRPREPLSGAKPIPTSLPRSRAWPIPGRFSRKIAAVFPLRDAAYAHQMSETEHVRGKIVLQVI